MLYYSTFLDDKEIAGRIYEMLANDILGKEQLEKIKLRYHDMSRNFFKYSKDEAEKSGHKDSVWEFSPGLEPFKPAGWERCYEDTTTVPIPITHPDFIDLTLREVKRGAIGLDLPTWFNLRNNDRRIMIVAQDPLRNNKWYSDVDIPEEDRKNKPGSKEDYVCIDALVSSPFGLHGRGWRENKRGGGRMALLVYDASESAEYSKGKKEIYKAILYKEIDIVNPKSIVALGNQAYSYCHEQIGDDARLLYVPHFSGAATWKAKDFFKIPGTQKVSIEELAEKYAEYIIREYK